MAAILDWRLELVQVPVSDVDRAQAFYTEKVGFNADQDHQVTDDLFDWGSIVFFKDPDGNDWAVQQIPARE